MKCKLPVVCCMVCGIVFNVSAQIDLGTDDIIGDEPSLEQSNPPKGEPSAFDNLNLFGSDNADKQPAPETIDSLKEKAHNGDEQAQLDLGYMFLYGANGANIDYKQAMHYYGLAAERKNPVALNNMGSLYFNGIGAEVDYSKAINYFEDAARLGSDDAALNLAIIYLGDSKKNKSVDEWQKIYDLLNQAQKSNYAAKFLLGCAYYDAFLVDKNYVKAFNLIKEAADNHYDEAQYILADLYIKGHGTPKNYSQAVKYLRAAVAQGHKDAIMRLGDILSEGKIYTKNIMNAHVLYNVASVFGVKGAAEKRDNLEKMIKIEDLLAVQANAENFKPEPSANTLFIRQTFGESMKAYIDTNIDRASKVKINTK